MLNRPRLFPCLKFFNFTLPLRIKVFDGGKGEIFAELLGDNLKTSEEEKVSNSILPY
jgi:hypothetical protein